MNRYFFKSFINFGVGAFLAYTTVINNVIHETVIGFAIAVLILNSKIFWVCLS